MWEIVKEKNIVVAALKATYRSGFTGEDPWGLNPPPRY